MSRREASGRWRAASERDAEMVGGTFNNTGTLTNRGTLSIGGAWWFYRPTLLTTRARVLVEGGTFYVRERRDKHR